MSSIQTINYKEKVYVVEKMSAECLEYLSHMQNLDGKLKEAEFNVKQLRTALTAFTTMFENVLPEPEVVTMETDSHANQEVQNTDG